MLFLHSVFLRALIQCMSKTLNKMQLNTSIHIQSYQCFTCTSVRYRMGETQMVQLTEGSKSCGKLYMQRARYKTGIQTWNNGGFLMHCFHVGNKIRQFRTSKSRKKFGEFQTIIGLWYNLVSSVLTGSVPRKKNDAPRKPENEWNNL